jgi:SAM-dependent methyltransferase
MVDPRRRGAVPSDRSADESKRRKRQYAEFRRRLYAWWEGIDLPPESAYSRRDSIFAEPLLLDMQAPDEPEPADGPPESPADRAKVWSPRRIAASELVWGQDCLLPGGTEYTVEIARPMGLSSAASLLELGSGLGGGSRALAQSFGVWVTGLERDADLASEALGRSRHAGYEKKAPVRGFDPQDFELQVQSFDCMFSRELFHTVADKRTLFVSLRHGLKDRGHIVFTDYVRGAQPLGQPFHDWAAGERLPSYLVSTDELVDLLQSLDFDCRTVADDSGPYRADAVDTWGRLAVEMEEERIPRHLLSHVVAEADRWGRFLRLLAEDQVRVCRIHAVYRAS